MGVSDLGVASLRTREDEIVGDQRLSGVAVLGEVGLEARPYNLCLGHSQLVHSLGCMFRMGRPRLPGELIAHDPVSPSSGCEDLG